MHIFVSELMIEPPNMYERKIPVDLDCPLRLTMSLIDSKWKSCILDELRHRPLRPSELHKLFPEATPRVLDIQLKELVEDGLVSKTIFPELPPRSEYAITPLTGMRICLNGSMGRRKRKGNECGMSFPQPYFFVIEVIDQYRLSLFRTSVGQVVHAVGIALLGGV